MKRPVLFLLLLAGMLLLPGLLEAEEIAWQPYKEGLAKGKSERKRIFINFYADW